MLNDPVAFGGDPADAFDVVVPAVPGYAFSDRPTEQGFEYRRVSRIWMKLMEGLGYDRFGAHAYNIGASIMTHMLLDHPERLVGYHTTEPENPAPYFGPGSAPMTEAEQAFETLGGQWMVEEGGYMALQTTRPQTLGYGLNDSPAGMAAWILEKWWAWTGPPSGSFLEHFSRDQLLAIVTLYWVTQTMNSANRLYYERFHAPRPRTAYDRIDVPLGVALTATQPTERPPREYVERLFTDIRHWIELPRGGHFIALEEPELVAASLRDFFRPLR
jgi:pimeloyl-ACP methyl ester carboxylesterase